MSIYPSLEDMKLDQLSQAQNRAINEYQENTAYPMIGASAPPVQNVSFYPSLGTFMGLELTEDVILQNMPEYSIACRQNNVVSTGYNTQMVAPLSGQSLGLQRAQISHGIRELTLCKGKDDKVGLRVKPINNGIFVCLIVKDSPAALAGLRFGDQILQINGKDLAGYTMEQVHDLLRKSPINGISVIVRDRPFERTITLHKDSTNHLGFQFKNGKITNLVKESSAARNGLLTEHQLLEVNGQNVISLKDKDITRIINDGGNIVTVTVIPSFIYDHMVKKMATSLIKGLMDHSIPDV